jgi:signal transduction histidine kinase/CheY-like chemotaxis protein
MTLAKKDGSSVFVHFFPRPLIAADGRFQGAFALVTDVTQRKILESQLLQAQKLESIGQLAAGIAHEINTPTQYVTDNTRFLEQSLQELLRLLGLQERLARQAEEQGLFAGLVADIKRVGIEIGLEYLKSELPISIEQTLEGLERIAKIVRSMKEFAHPGPDVKTPADLNKAIANTVTVARNEWKYVAEVVTDLDPELPPVPCVVGEINQVVLNVIVNAAHAIADTIAPGQERKGTIRISTRRDGDFVEIRVADDGPGIPPAIRNRVFDPFFTTKQPGKGTGLGLSTVYGIVKGHGGHIFCQSSPGQGTTFEIYLPPDSTEDVQVDPANDPQEDQAQGTGGILLVDDEEALRHLGAHTLTKAGYRVEVAASGEESLEKYRAMADQIDLVVMDLGMPGMGGHQALKAILEINSQAKVVIASGYAANEQVREALDSGAAGYVGKPFKRAELLATVRGVLEAGFSSR